MGRSERKRTSAKQVNPPLDRQEIAEGVIRPEPPSTSEALPAIQHFACQFAAFYHLRPSDWWHSSRDTVPSSRQ